MHPHRLTEIDYQFMELVWENEPLSSRRLVTLCAERFGWKKSTTYTVLKKLCERGYAQNENACVRACVAREKVQAVESERLLKRSFSNSLPLFLASFLGGKTISAQEAEELKRLIDAHRE